VWTLGDPSSAGGGVEKHYLSLADEKLALRGLIDWNGDGTTDALVLTETATGDDFAVKTLLVWWGEDGVTQRSMLTGA
jgi:hypothetical protein